MFQCNGQVLNYNTMKTAADSYEILPSAKLSLLSNTQTVLLPLVSTYTDRPSSLVRGPFQVSLFSMAVVDHVFTQQGANTQRCFCLEVG